MLALVLDTATPAVTTGIVRFDGGSIRVLAESITVDAKAHGELLSPSIRSVLEAAGLRPDELDAVVAGVGPGPFTGLRVGLVTAAAFADAIGVPTYGQCSLDAIGMAAGLPADPLADAAPPSQAVPSGAGVPSGLEILVATDARRKELYWARYRDGLRVGDPDVARPAELELAGLTAMAGAGARLYAAELGLPLLDHDHPRVAELATLVADRVAGGAPAEVLTPLYLRRPDAVVPAAMRGRS
ncbi:tRNA (adenosine(37)-N6)-threonylcarbamoyltransferase complex dimerization subunit type 1 TsaB [Jatrophihabitans telluris]|uniref:tRNA (Adenosine(37)-N6)-threonylcarbamoyltransferase complex dimerization subunit type 1 TsaB n=1 Tax=Jatrophihabitans telluris TaxID=2038343 RepID=A0ABY4QXP5_9ACTN|nr:tRNA (adenosine(37)-N6)-threonylcarbamoyltransferase complex dimerization subunit type 1 TsaB [Jatrophihabitans telluris]UQX87912.1 tRNA (adenosine(37)-N6)-threonylcarbamoyltransferase complex dimerization subunit type 1 TsaB [Jatrophihabitans telluris]